MSDGSNRIPFPILSLDRWSWGMSYVKSFIEVAKKMVKKWVEEEERGRITLLSRNEISRSKEPPKAAELGMLRAHFSFSVLLFFILPLFPSLFYCFFLFFIASRNVASSLPFIFALFLPFFPSFLSFLHSLIIPSYISFFLILLLSPFLLYLK